MPLQANNFLELLRVGYGSAKTHWLRRALYMLLIHPDRGLAEVSADAGLSGVDGSAEFLVHAQRDWFSDGQQSYFEEQGERVENVIRGAVVNAMTLSLIHSDGQSFRERHLPIEFSVDFSERYPEVSAVVTLERPERIVFFHLQAPQPREG